MRMGEGFDKTIALLTLGCKLNYAETSTYERGFVEAGLQVVPWSHGADLYLVNTCSVTATSDAKSRNLIRKVNRINPSAVIVVTGCSAQLRRADYEGLPGVARVFGCDEKSLVVPETLEILSSRPGRVASEKTLPPSARKREGPTRRGGRGREAKVQKDYLLFYIF